MASPPWLTLLLESLLSGIARESFLDECTVQCEKYRARVSIKLVIFHNINIKAFRNKAVTSPFASLFKSSSAVRTSKHCDILHSSGSN